MFVDHKLHKPLKSANVKKQYLGPWITQWRYSANRDLVRSKARAKPGVTPKCDQDRSSNELVRRIMVYSNCRLSFNDTQSNVFNWGKGKKIQTGTLVTKCHIESFKNVT